MEVDNIHGITFEVVWGEKSADILSDIISLWKELKIATGKDPHEKRAKQAVAIARNNDGKVIAIATAVPTLIKEVKNYMFVFRTLIHRDYRIPGLLANLTDISIKTLESKNDNTCIGVIARIENERLKAFRNIHSPSGLNFIGFSSNGDPLRAYFFKGAKF